MTKTPTHKYKVGDQLILSSHSRAYYHRKDEVMQKIVDTVARLTKTQLVTTGGHRFTLLDYNGDARYRIHGEDGIKIVEPGDVAKLDKTIENDRISADYYCALRHLSKKIIDLESVHHDLSRSLDARPDITAAIDEVSSELSELTSNLKQYME